MDYGKYIIIKGPQGIEVAIMFDLMLSHDDFLKIYLKEDIVSAGFFTVGAEPRIDDSRDISVSVHGESTTLKIETRKGQDERLLKRVLRKKY